MDIHFNSIEDEVEHVILDDKLLIHKTTLIIYIYIYISSPNLIFQAIANASPAID